MAKRKTNWAKIRDHWIMRNVAPVTSTRDGWAHYTLKQLAADFELDYQRVRDHSSAEKWRTALHAARKRVRAAAQKRAEEEAAESVAQVYAGQLRICQKALGLAERQLDIHLAGADLGIPQDLKDVTGLLNAAMAHQRQAAGLGDTLNVNVGEERRERIQEHERLRGLFGKALERLQERLEDMEPAGHA